MKRAALLPVIRLSFVSVQQGVAGYRDKAYRNLTTVCTSDVSPIPLLADILE